ncbi:hypothetical protein MANES_16G102500v8 [Manihot esculenta]|uniref:Uncharacterized protein n=1 Tax=Manihot esculenta TaxID=3983 RepID=A0A2C9UBF6_MANES|nr:hypothetical protein MANES_16G102500v8 [Manihot esculenta]
MLHLPCSSLLYYYPSCMVADEDSAVILIGQQKWDMALWLKGVSPVTVPIILSTKISNFSKRTSV